MAVWMALLLSVAGVKVMGPMTWLPASFMSSVNVPPLMLASLKDRSWTAFTGATPVTPFASVRVPWRVEAGSTASGCCGLGVL